MPKVKAPTMQAIDVKKRKIADFEVTKTILLNYNDSSSALLWVGVSKIKENDHEEPLVLNFDNKDFYFYRSGIQEERSKVKKQWINYLTKLSLNQKEQLSEAFAKKIDENNLFHHLLSLKLKAIFLDNKINLLILHLQKKEDFSEQELYNFKQELKPAYQKISWLNQAIEQKLNFEDLPKDVTQLKNFLGQENLNIEYFKTFLNYLANKFEYLEEVEDIQKLQWYKNNSKGSKVIILKSKIGRSLIWWGNKKKNPVISEEPLVLNFDNEDFYFYSSGIKRVAKINYRWVDYKFELEINTQDKILEHYAKIIDQNNLNQKSILLLLKTNYLRTAVKFLTENLDDEKNLDDKFKNLKSIHTDFKDKIEPLSNEVNIFSNWVESFYGAPKKPKNLEIILQQKNELLEKEVNLLYRTYNDVMIHFASIVKPKVNDDQPPKFWKKTLLGNFENVKPSTSGGSNVVAPSSFHRPWEDSSDGSNVATTSYAQPVIETKNNFELKEDELEPEVITLD
ncbi:MAG: hypothetical protein REH79_02595 [Spiroplasma sp.]|nr:hypothetical protein [Spiroplasma sp.]